MFGVAWRCKTLCGVGGVLTDIDNATTTTTTMISTMDEDEELKNLQFVYGTNTKYVPN